MGEGVLVNRTRELCVKSTQLQKQCAEVVRRSKRIVTESKVLQRELEVSARARAARVRMN